MNQTISEPLTPREIDILAAIVTGMNNAEIAARLVLSHGTVKWYVKQLYSKLSVHSREEAIAQALAQGLVPDPFGRKDQTQNSDCALVNALPQDVTGRYVGNAKMLSQLADMFQQSARLIGVYGRAGAGKTALVCKALSELRRCEQSRQHLLGIVCLSAVSTGISLARLIEDVGRLLGEQDQAVMAAIARSNELNPSQKTELVLEKITGKRIVVLLDNLESVQNPATGELIETGLQQFVETSLTRSSALTLLVTSRIPLALPRTLKTWENLISLEDGLPTEDAVALLRKFDPAGTAGLRDATTEELQAVVGQLGGFPRALESVAGMLLEDPLLRLVDVRQNVSLLEGEISAAVVQQALAHLNMESMRVLAGLAVFGEPVPFAALSYLLSPYLVEAALRPLLGRLIGACFVKTNQSPDQAGAQVVMQLSLHTIDQGFCYNQIPSGTALPGEIAGRYKAGEIETGQAPFTRSVLHRRAADYYHGLRLPVSAWRRAADVDPQIHEVRHLAQSGAGDDAARVLLEIDRDYLWEWGSRALLHELYARLDGLVRNPHLILEVARRRAWQKFFTEPQEADHAFTENLAEARRLGFVKEEADALDDLAQTFRRNNQDFDRGLEHHRQALTLYRQIGDKRGEADALGGLGAIYSQFEPEEAIEYLLEAVRIQRSLGSHTSLSFLFTLLGAAYGSLGQSDHALQACREAVAAASASGSLLSIARAYGGLSISLILSGDISGGLDCVRKAFAQAPKIAGVPMTPELMYVSSTVAIYLAFVGQAAQAIQLAEESFRAGAAVFPQMMGMGVITCSLLWMLKGDLQRARSLLTPMSENYVIYWALTYWIGVLLIKTGEKDSAAAFMTSVLNRIGADVPGGLYQEIITRPVRALLFAGLALIQRDATLAQKAADLSREALKIRNIQTDLLPVFIGLLSQEEGGEMLRPVQQALSSINL